MRRNKPPPQPPDYAKIPVSIDGLRFEALKERGIVATRTDMVRKQRHQHFPRPVKLAGRYAWFPLSWIEAWIAWRVALHHYKPTPPPEPEDKEPAPLEAAE